MKYCSKECRYLASRKITPDQRRNSYLARSWRKAVLLRDNYTCQHCGSTTNLAAHHIKSWAEYIDLRYDINNGLTLCEDCHSIEHNGRKLVHHTKAPVCCKNCGAIKKTRVGDYCKSCAMKLSPKAQASYALMRHDSNGRFTR